jgi:hypothetical protein
MCGSIDELMKLAQEPPIKRGRTEGPGSCALVALVPSVGTLKHSENHPFGEWPQSAGEGFLRLTV